jgi:hypothetical protein
LDLTESDTSGKEGTDPIFEFHVAEYYCNPNPTAVHRRVIWNQRTESPCANYLGRCYQLQDTCESVSFAGFQRAWVENPYVDCRMVHWNHNRLYDSYQSNSGSASIHKDEFKLRANYLDEDSFNDYASPIFSVGFPIRLLAGMASPDLKLCRHATQPRSRLAICKGT